MRKFLFAIVAVSALLFTACDDKDKGVSKGKVLVYAAEYDAAKDDWTLNSDGTHVFGSTAVSTVEMVWNKWDNCHETFIKVETEKYDGDVEIAGPDWLEYYELAGEANVIKLVSETAPIEGAEGTLTFTATDGKLGSVKIVAPAIDAPFTVVFPTASDTPITTLHFDFNGNFNMGTEDAPAWGETSAYGNLTAAVDGDAAPKAFILSKTGNALSAEAASWVHFSYGEEDRATVGTKRVIVSVDAQAEGAAEREAYIIFVPYDSAAAAAADVLSGSAIADAYKSFPQFPIKQNAWREVLAFEFKDGYHDSFQSLDEFVPDYYEVWGNCSNYYQLTYTEYTVDEKGEFYFPTGLYLNFDFAKYEIYASSGNEGDAYFTWTASETTGDFNWLRVNQAASSNPYIWQFAMTGRSSLPYEKYSYNTGYVLFYANATDTTPYAVLKCEYEGDAETPGTSDGLTIVDTKAWEIEKLDAGNDLYGYFGDMLGNPDGVIYLCHYNGKLEDMPTNVKIAGVPASNEYGDIMIDFAGSSDDGIVSGGICDWVLHEGDEQEYGYPQESTGYIECQFATDEIDTSNGFTYAVARYMNGKTWSTDMLIVFEMMWE